MKVRREESDHTKRKRPEQFLAIGARGQAVVELQKALKAGGYDVEVDGKFGRETHNAVIRAQGDANIKVDGIVGPKTRSALAKLSEGSLTIGSRGEAVTKLQKTLKAGGYDVEVDGKFGRETHNAVIRAQGDSNIKVDGVVGPKTRAALTKLKQHPQQGDGFGSSQDGVTQRQQGDSLEAPSKTKDAKPRTLETTSEAISGGLPYSKTDVSLSTRAGYVGPRASEARFRSVTLKTAEGTTERRSLLPAINAKNVWYDKTGNEYYLTPTTSKDKSGQTRTIYTVANEQKATGTGNVVSTQLPQGSFIVPSLGKKAEDRIAELRKQGFEVTAVLGTGFIDSKGKKIVGYHYVNEARLRGEAAPASAGKSVDGLGSGKIHSGYRITRSGEMKLLDFEGKTRDQIRAELKKLEANPDTAAINLFSHVAADKPSDLAGVLGATNQPTAHGKSRSLLVFDKKGDFVGHIQTPAVSLLDSVTIARQRYGDRAAKVLNQDGDFYAQSWFSDGRPPSSERALHFDNAMIVARKATAGQKPKNQPEKNPLQKAVDNARYWTEENIVDPISDALNWAKAKASGG